MGEAQQVAAALLFIGAGIQLAHTFEAVQKNRAGWAVVLFASGIFCAIAGVMINA